MVDRPDAKQYEGAISEGLTCIKRCKAKVIFLCVRDIEDIPEYLFKYADIDTIITVRHTKKRSYEEGTGSQAYQNKKTR